MKYIWEEDDILPGKKFLFVGYDELIEYIIILNPHGKYGYLEKESFIYYEVPDLLKFLNSINAIPKLEF